MASNIDQLKLDLIELIDKVDLALSDLNIFESRIMPFSLSYSFKAAKDDLVHDSNLRSEDLSKMIGLFEELLDQIEREDLERLYFEKSVIANTLREKPWKFKKPVFFYDPSAFIEEVKNRVIMDCDEDLQNLNKIPFNIKEPQFFDLEKEGDDIVNVFLKVVNYPGMDADDTDFSDKQIMDMVQTNDAVILELNQLIHNYGVRNLICPEMDRESLMDFSNFVNGEQEQVKQIVEDGSIDEQDEELVFTASFELATNLSYRILWERQVGLIPVENV